MSSVDKGIATREGKDYEEGVNSEVKLTLHKTNIDFKRYLHRVGDADTRLLFKFRSGTYGLKEELGRHRGRNGKTEIWC